MKRLVQVDGRETLNSEELKKIVYYKKGSLTPRLQNTNLALHNYYLFVLNGSPLPPADMTPPMLAMNQVADHLRARLSAMDRPQLLLWKRKILNQAKLIWVDLATEGIDRYLAFDAINSRGLPLSEFDKIKNFCILVDTKHGLSLDAANAWYLATTELQKFGVASRSDEATFVTDLFSVFHDQPITHASVHQEFVNKYRPLLTGADPALEGDLRAFVGLWQPFAKSLPNHSAL